MIHDRNLDDCGFEKKITAHGQGATSRCAPASRRSSREFSSGDTVCHRTHEWPRLLRQAPARHGRPPAVPAWLNKSDNASAATFVGIQSAAGGFPRRARVVPRHAALRRSWCTKRGVTHTKPHYPDAASLVLFEFELTAIARAGAVVQAAGAGRFAPRAHEHRQSVDGVHVAVACGCSCSSYTIYNSTHSASGAAASSIPLGRHRLLGGYAVRPLLRSRRLHRCLLGTYVSRVHGRCRATDRRFGRLNFATSCGDFVVGQGKQQVRRPNAGACSQW